MNPVRFLRGEVRVRAAGRNPERLLNLCAARGIPFRDLVREDADTIVLSLSRRDWKRLRRAVTGDETASQGTRDDRAAHGVRDDRAAHGVRGNRAAQSVLPDCTLRVVRRAGAPALLARLRRRPVLAVSLTMGAFALFLGSFFIWAFDVEGNRTVSTEAILRALERQGVGIGSFGLSLDGQDLRNHVLLDIPELAWMTVNVSGCRAKVQVVERVEPPEILNEAQPANVTARRAGVVREVRALNGKARVMRGMSVDAGDLLISGTEELGNLSGGVRTMAAHGSVTARTWHTLTAAAPLSGTEKRYTGETLTETALLFGKHRLKLFPLRDTARAVRRAASGSTGVDGAGTDGKGIDGTGRDGAGTDSAKTNGAETAVRYDKTVQRTAWTLLGAALPVTLSRETYRFYEAVPVERTAAEARDRTEAALRSYLDADVSPYGEVRSVLCTARRRGSVLEVTLAAECQEEIGVVVPLTGETGQDVIS